MVKAATAGDVAVVVPLFNKAAYVRESVGALVSQDVPLGQIIVVDDGSTDGSVEELRGFGDAVTLIRQENAGPSAARNRGLAAATASYVAFADADNRWHANRLRWIFEAIGQFPDVNWFSGGYRRIRANGEAASSYPQLRHHPADSISVIDYFEARRQARGLNASETFVVKREAFQRLGGFDESLRVNEITFAYLTMAADDARMGYINVDTVDIYHNLPDSLFSSLRCDVEASWDYARSLVRLALRYKNTRPELVTIARKQIARAQQLAESSDQADVARQIEEEFRNFAPWYRRYVRQMTSMLTNSRS